MGGFMGLSTFSGLSLATKKSLWVNHADYVLLASMSPIVVNKDGTIRNTKRPILAPAGRPTPSEELPMPRELFLRKLVLKPNSPTLLFVSVSAYSLLRTERRSLLSSLMK